MNGHLSAEIEYFEFFTIPDDENYKLTELEEKLEDSDYDMYELHEELLGFINDITNQESDNLHQILGHDRSIQSSVVYDFAAKEIKVWRTDEYQKRWKEILKIATSYEILLQIDCDDSNTDLPNFGGSGTYYFGITKTDLEQYNLSNIRMIYQST